MFFAYIYNGISVSTNSDWSPYRRTNRHGIASLEHGNCRYNQQYFQWVEPHNDVHHIRDRSDYTNCYCRLYV